MQLSDHSAKIYEAWDFPWPVIDTLIGGRSSIDLPELFVKDWLDATNFIRGYGFDPDSDTDIRHLHATFIEAVHFIERYLFKFDPPHGRPIPRDILDSEDVRELLLFASSGDPKEREKKVWACAILRVMHTISHIEGVHKAVSAPEARDQIRKRFEDYLEKDRQGRLWLGTPDDRIELFKVEWKTLKSRDSIILKLLHKRANVAETIYDMFGVRLITKRVSDTMMAVKFLRKYFMVTFPNCVPSRARNSLVNVEAFKEDLAALRAELSAGKIDAETFEKKLEAAVKPVERELEDLANPHSGMDYRSLQLTCRQLIKTENPALNWYCKLRQLCGEDSKLPARKITTLKELELLIGEWPGFSEELNISAFFPFEVQILDEHTYVSNQIGDASHVRYKESQIKAARRRIMNDVIKFYGE